jgi:hypothetical protein
MAKKRKGPRSKTAPRSVAARVKEGQAVQLRMAGANLAEIAAAVGYADPSGADRALQRGMARLGQPEEAAKLRQLELARLDRMQRSIWEKARDGHGESIDRVLRIMERRARYCGLDAPVKVAETDSQGRDLVRVEITRAVIQQLAPDERTALMAVLEKVRLRVAQTDEAALLPGPDVVGGNGQPPTGNPGDVVQ